MKKVFAIALAASVLAFLSCESTKQESPAQSQEPNKVEQASTPAAPAEKENKKESGPVSTAISSKSQYKKLLQDIKISVLSSPRETVKGKAFAAPYKIRVTNLAGEPLASLKMTAEYPATRNQESVNYARAEIVTDANGAAEFVAPVPEMAASANVLFYPLPPSSDPDLIKQASAIAAQAPWKAKSNLGARTGILVSIADYKQNGKFNIGNGSQPSAQALTSNLWRAGFMGAQNADFHNSVDADDPTRIRNDALKQLSGNSLFKYVIYGRVKYAGEITQDADGYYSVTFNGDLGALSISTGEVLLKASKSVTVKDKSEWKAISNAQQEMAKLFCEEVIYSLSN
ncbi:MAG: hypothetical protein J6V90_09605 [Treponema sp.]|nr:hypothetical protein [Treponema sp.]